MGGKSAHQVVRPGWWIAPWAALDTAVTHCAPLVREVEAGAAFHIQFPGLITVVHHLIAHRNGLTGTVLGANFAALAEALQAEIDGFVRNDWHIGQDSRSFKTKTQIRIQDNPYPADLPDAGSQQ